MGFGVFDPKNRIEPGSDLAGTPAVRQQGALGFLQEAFNSRPSFFGGPSSPPTRANTSAVPPRNLLADRVRGEGQFANTRPTGAGTPKYNNPFPIYPDAERPAPYSPEVSPFSLINQIRDIGLDQAKKTTSQIALEKIGAAADQRRATQSELIKTAYQRRQEEFYAGLNSILDQTSAAYGDRITELQDELAGYRGGLNDVNAAYANYADDADAILKEAAAAEANPLPESAVVASVGKNFDKFGGIMSETLSKIDGNGNGELALAMAGEVKYMEGVIEDGLRSELMTQDEMHQMAGAQAQALANMAWKDDAYESERARFQLELEINQSIEKKQDDIANARKEMDRALADARSQYGDFTLTPDELWDAALDDYFTSSGLNLQEQDDMRRLWAGIRDSNPQAMANYDIFKSSVMRAANEQNLAQIGALDDYDRITRQLQARAEEGDTQALSILSQIETAMTSPLSTASLRALTTMASRFGVDLGGIANIDLDSVEWENLEDSASLKYQSMLDLWGHHNDYRNNYDEYISQQSTQTARTGGSQAPNNYGNRFTPDYAYRREVVAPHFADTIKKTFPSYGIRIGGLGYMRPPSDVGGGKAKNSDHQSGGAIDVYANTEQQRKSIAAWARNQPGVSLVIYEGNKAHEGHHVHLSFQTGYRV